MKLNGIAATNLVKAHFHIGGDPLTASDCIRLHSPEPKEVTRSYSLAVCEQ